MCRPNSPVQIKPGVSVSSEKALGFPVPQLPFEVIGQTIERVATSEQHCGKRIMVETPTHWAGVMDFVEGPVATLITSFDVWYHNLPILEVYGSEGSLSVPDPNGFGGIVRVRRAHLGGQAGAQDWKEMPLTHSAEARRGIGIADLVRAQAAGRPHRASGELVYHVLDVMCAFDDASQAGRHVEIASRCGRPAALPMGMKVGEMD